MNFAQLVALFRNRADELDKDDEKSAQYRALNYRVAADKLSGKFRATQRVTHAALEQSGLTPYMQGRALEFCHAANDTESQITKKKSTKQAKPAAQNVQISKSTAPSRAAVINSFAAVSGIGQKRAAEFYARGARTLADLLKDPALPIEARVFLELKPTARIERAVIDRFHARLQACVARYNSTHRGSPIEMIITGSYRRGLPSSGDIDICAVMNDVGPDIEIPMRVLRDCFGRDKVRQYSNGPDKVSAIVVLTDEDPRVKVDVWLVPEENRGSMLLYTTGSKQHNITMRARAKSMGFLLNQEGLFSAAGKKITLHTEKDYFRALKMPYVEPRDR